MMNLKHSEFLDITGEPGVWTASLRCRTKITCGGPQLFQQDFKMIRVDMGMRIIICPIGLLDLCRD